MRILIVTPAPPKSRKGNRITALRWAKLICESGHHVEIAEAFSNQTCDLLIGMHARRSAKSILKFRNAFPKRPLIVALTGTDLYRDIKTSRTAQHSLDLADRLVLLQSDGRKCLDASLQDKVEVIRQSATGLINPPAPLHSRFEVVVVGHLRHVKDPFRAAYAARGLPKSSRIQIIHIGAALTESMAVRAKAEMVRNPRYQWLGELSPAKTKQRLARARLMVLSSRMEGGANVISESIAVDTPIIASRISGSVGLLGEDYPAYFLVGDTNGLRDLLQAAEEDSRFLEQLRETCLELKPLVSPRQECDDWNRLIGSLPQS